MTDDSEKPMETSEEHEMAHTELRRRKMAEEADGRKDGTDEDTQDHPAGKDRGRKDRPEDDDDDPLDDLFNDAPV